MSFAEDLTALATDLKIVQQDFERESPAGLDHQDYLTLANRLYNERQKYGAEPTLQKGKDSIRDTATHMIKAMGRLAGMAKDLAELREAYVPSKESGNLRARASDIKVMRRDHDKVTNKLNKLVEEIESVAASLARSSGGGNSSQVTDDGNSYRVVPIRMKGEYRRGLRRSG